MSSARALEHFKKVDPVLYRITQTIGPLPELTPVDPKNYFVDLCEIIVSQQLSGKVATVIWNRILDLFPDKKITSKKLLEIPDQTLRVCGLSWAKIHYIKDLAHRNIDFSHFPTLTEEEIVKKLLQVKGIGNWTVEMFLIFTMGKYDIFSNGDLGLKNAMKKLPGIQDPSVWSPYRSYACRILWKSLKVR